MKFLRGVAKKLAAANPFLDPYLDDLIQDGWFGIEAAKHSFNPECGSSFESYAYQFVHGAMWAKAFEYLSPVSRTNRKQKQLKDLIDLSATENLPEDSFLVDLDRMIDGHRVIIEMLNKAKKHKALRIYLRRLILGMSSKEQLKLENIRTEKQLDVYCGRGKKKFQEMVP